MTPAPVSSFILKPLLKPVWGGLLWGLSTLVCAQPADDKVFTQHGEMLAINDVCKRHGVDHTAKLDQLTQARVGLLQKMALHSAAAPEAKAELLAVAERIRKNDHNKAAYDKQRKASLQLPAKKRDTQCTSLPQQVDEELRMIREVQSLIESMGQLPTPTASAASAASSAN